MFFSVEMADLVLYCVQQLGVMLAVGAETIVLIAYAVSMRDGKIDETEARFSRAVHRALAVGILCIVASGVAITILHAALNQYDVIFQPVFLFKWLLVLILIGIYVLQRMRPFSHPLIEGVIGGTWYALFLVHILAPITSWGNLFMLYGVLLGGFVAVWSATLRITGVKKSMPAQKKEMPAPIKQKEEEKKVEKPAPPPMPIKIAQTPPLPPKPIMPPLKPVVQPVPKPVPPASVVIVPPPLPPPAPPVIKKEQENDPHHSPWLPAIHFMPKDQAELDAKAHIMPLGAINPNS